MKSAVEAVMERRRNRTASLYSPWQQLRWAVARLMFHAYIGFSMGTLGLGGFLTGPLMTWYFYGDWRFWRHWSSAKYLFPHSFRMLSFVLRGHNGGFMLSVPLTAPPHTSVDPDRVALQATWEFGSACGPCSRCCSKLGCPVLDQKSGLCRGYDSFFWRYFNCGRFPTEQGEIDYYLCNKWEMREDSDRATHAHPTPSREELVA